MADTPNADQTASQSPSADAPNPNADRFLGWMMGGAETGTPESPDRTLTQSPSDAGSAASKSRLDVAITGYETLAELGRGGMGVVFKARQLKLNRIVALKMILSAARGHDATRFLIEAEAVAAVKHPNVVQVFEYGESDGQPFLAMEFLEGGSLAARLGTAGQFEPRVAAAVVAKIARGVQAAHDAGVVHRDLKPGNVLLDAAGEPKVTDFGLAKRVGGADLTATQAVMGTPAYMSPEQARGETKFVGPGADIYALGVILYECLTGTVPFRGEDSWSVVRQVIERDPDPLRSRTPGVPRDLELICLKCLAKSPRDRYPTAANLADDLDRFLNREPVSVRPAGVPERAVKWVRRNPSAARLLSVSAVAAVVISGLALKYHWDIREADEREQLSAARAAVADEQTRRAEMERAASARAASDRDFIRLLTQARNRRLAARSGWTWAAREDLTQAVALPHDVALDAELRDEWVATMVAPDAREVAPGADRWRLPERTEDGHQLAANPTRPQLAVTLFGYPGGLEFQLSVQLLDTRDGSTVASLKAPVDVFNRNPGGYKESPAGLAFSPDGKWLVMSARSGKLHRWDVSGSTPGAVASWPGRGHGGAVAFSPDGRTMYTRGGPWLQVWDTGTWKEIAARDLGGDPASITPVPTADRLVVTMRGKVSFLDPHDLSDLSPMLVPGDAGVVVAADGRTGLLADGRRVGALDLFSRTGMGLLDFQPAPGTGRPLPGVSPDGRFAVVTQPEVRGVGLYDLGNGRRVCQLTIPDRDGSPPFAFSPDGGTLYVGGRNRVRVFQLSAGGRTAALRPSPIARIGTSPDGRSTR